MLSTGIQDLALELVQEIVLYASHGWDNSPSKADLSQLRLVSRPFKAAADPFLFSEIVFDFIRRPLHGVIEQLNDLALQRTSAYRYIRTLKIESTEVQLSGPIAQGKYGFLLMHALKSLRNVRSIRWTLDRFEGIYTVLDGIVDLPHLEELYFEFSTLPTLWQTTDMIVLRRFAHLQVVSFRGRNLSSPLAASFIQQLRRINAANQSLRGLEIDFTDMLADEETYPGFCILHEIVKDVPRATPLKLRHLRVQGWNFRLDSITVPHLQCLSSLNISSMKDTGPDQQAHVWHGMIKANIHLRKISTGVVSQPLIHYLTSYTGLEHLTITSRKMRYEFVDDSDASEVLWAELCQSALPAHKSTLKAFQMLDRSEVRHCMSLDTIAAIRACEKLESLTITVKVDELESPDNVRRILITALDLPRLRTLDVDYSRPRRIGHRCQCANARAIRQRNEKFESVFFSFDVLRDFTRSLGSTQIIFNRKRYVAQVVDVEDNRVQFRVESRLARSGKWVNPLD
ncbi:hypothetical protein CVT25_001478 [Psilocybe cyanescens]|uniref:F-box domain-containing protein n=1 Tax=Psilocybe cyanescens TaxID=93625 RepID=A0A409WNP7_PSICY|nr:hypothetical protein CVT25_001478 [Psilocybe cyanescens]